MPTQGHGWTRLAGSAPVRDGPATLHGLIYKASAGGAQISVYDGYEVDSGELIGTFEGPNNETVTVSFFGGLRIQRGIYVSFGSNLDEALIVWDPIWPDKPANKEA